jgi:hypothetical protein
VLTSDASAGADATLAWAPTVKTSDPADSAVFIETANTPDEAALAWAPTQRVNTPTPTGASLSWAETVVFTDKN